VKDIGILVEGIGIQVEGIDLQVEHLSAEHFPDEIHLISIIQNKP